MVVIDPGSEQVGQGTLEERVYFCQNWRADVSAILTDTGKMVEWDKYSAYGVPSGLPAGDTDSDGDWDATDSGAYDVRKDTELDGDVDARDVLHANSITGTYQTLGRGVLSSSAVNNRRGYAGYEYDPTFEGAERHLYHVRHRVYDADVGRWTRRDPLGYVDGMSLYAYVRSVPLQLRDPFGLSGDDDKKGRKTSFPRFDHNKYGAYYKWRVNCKGITIEREGYGRVNDIMIQLSRLAGNGCCVESFSISTHHSGAAGVSFSCDDGSDGISDAQFAASLKLCNGASVILNSCNSCGLAQQIKDNTDATDVSIRCTDGDNLHHPGLGINFTPAGRFIPGFIDDSKGKKKKVKTPKKPPPPPPPCPKNGPDDDDGIRDARLPDPLRPIPIPDMSPPLPGDLYPLDPVIAGGVQ